MDMDWEIKEEFPVDVNGCSKGYEIEVEIHDCFSVAAYNRPGERPEEVINKLKAELEAVISKYRI